jgi:multiple antibiotic resistance protein
LNLLNQPADDSSQKVQPGTLEDALQHAFFPLTLPLTVGPGGISVAITLGAHLRYQAGPGFVHGYPVILSRRLAACFWSVFSS